MTLVLASVGTVHFAKTPEKAAAPASHGGMVAFEAKEAGVFRVALSGKGWVDVIEAGAVLPSVAHGHGEPCSPARKVVDFRLAAGRHVLQFSGSADPAVTVLVRRLR